MMILIFIFIMLYLILSFLSDGREIKKEQEVNDRRLLHLKRLIYAVAEAESLEIIGSPDGSVKCVKKHC